MRLILDDVWDIHHAEIFHVEAPCATLVSSRIPSVAESLSSPGEAYRLDVLSDEKAGALLQLLAPKLAASA